MDTDVQAPYSLNFDEASNKLYGIVIDTSDWEKVPVVTGFHIQNHLRELNYHEFLISPINLNKFIKNLKNKKPGEYFIGERRDAKAEIQLASDLLSATLKITRAWGGEELTNTKILETIQQSKLDKECLMSKTLKKVAEDHNHDIEILISKARLPIAGQDAALQALIGSQREKDHELNTSDAIDQHDVYEFLVVEPGQALLKKIPATPGSAGKNVLGKEISPQAGKDIPLTTPFEGVEASPDNENLVVANIKGHPVFSRNGVKVDPVLTLEEIDIHSGNIDYDGSVLIKKNVASGFIVKANGNVHIKGQIEKANIMAKGDITIGCGILGEEEDGKLKARLSCDGNLQARFINLAFVNCGGEIYVDEYIMQSRISATGDILVGQQKGRGRIIGGFCSSEGNIRAKSIGSDAYIATSLSLGNEQNSSQEIKQLQADLERRTDELIQLGTILDKIKSGKSPSQIGKLQLDKTRKIHRTVLALENQVEKLNLKIEHLLARDSDSEHKIHISGNIYPNVSISISGHGWHCDEELKRQSFFLHHNFIVHKTMDQET